MYYAMEMAISKGYEQKAITRTGANTRSDTKPDNKETGNMGVVKDMVDTLSECALVFREYERLHLQKETADGNMKAKSNASIAMRCEAVLRNYKSKRVGLLRISVGSLIMKGGPQYD